MKNNTIYIGVDPGLSGGIAVIYPDRVEVMKMPLKNGEIDVWKLIGWIPFDDSIACVEKVWAMSRGKIAVASLNFSAGVIHGLLGSLAIPITKVAPSTWRKAVLKNYRASKQDAVNFCCENYPTVEIYGDHNLAEAICIAQYGKITWNE